MTITTIAGSVTTGNSGEGGPATSAQLMSPGAVATDSLSGSVFITDIMIYKVQMVSSTGIITTFAGMGTMGSSGDNGAATSAYLYGPNGVATDNNGNVFIVDAWNNRIRKVSSTGIITTFAGMGTMGTSGDNGAATSAYLNGPNGVAVDISGNVYIADSNNYKVRMVTPSNGIITTIAGIGSYGCTGDNGAATSAYLSNLNAIAVDINGNLYIADYFKIRKVTRATGIITIFAGAMAQTGSSGDGGPATSALFSSTNGVAINSVGTVFIVDSGNYVIRMVTIDGIISTIAGTRGVYGTAGDGGAPASCSFQNLRGIAVDSSDRVYLTDGSRIRRIGNTFACPAGSYVSSFTSSTCAACPTGTYSASTNITTSCTLCMANTYMSSTGATACTVCPAGTMNFVVGATSVASCTVREDVCFLMFTGRFLSL